MTTTTTTPAAWGWVLENARTIERFSWRFIRGTSLGFDDFRAELITDLAEMFPKYDPSRASPSTWIWMRAARVRRGMVRAAVRGTSSPLLDVDPVPAGAYGNEDRASARAEVSSLLDRATPHQRAAALSVLRGWDRSEVRTRLGVSMPQRDALLRTIGGES